MPLPSLSTPIGNTGISIDPSKAARTALLVAKNTGRLHFDAGGNALKQAISNFSQARNDEFAGPRSTPGAEDRMLQAMLWPQQHQLAVAEPPQYRQQPMTQNMGDLGDEIERGAKFLKGENPDDDDNAPATGQPTKEAVVNAATGHQSGNAPPVVSGVHVHGLQNGNSPPLIVSKSYGTPAGHELASPNPNYHYAALNNPGNIGFGDWAQKHGAVTHAGWDTGHAIAGFPDLDTGYQAMATLAANKYGGGQRTLYGLIAGKNGWTPGNKVAADNIAGYMGVRPDEDLRLDEPERMRAFQRALTLQETGSSAQFDAWNNDQNDKSAASPPERAQAQEAPPAPPQPQPAPQSSQTQPNDASAGPQAQARPPMSDLYDRLAFSPDVQAGYDNPQVMFDPNDVPSAARGGYLRRAWGRPAYSAMPTNELIDKALRIIRKHRDSGGGVPPPKSIAQIQQQMQDADTRQAAIALGSDLNNQRSAGSGSQFGGASPEQAQYNLYRDEVGFLGAPPTAPSPSGPPAPNDNTPAVKNGTVGNQGNPTGAGINDAPTSGPPSYDPGNPSITGPTSPIPMASPTGFNGYNYNNSLDQVLGTNDPTQNQIFGFNYPQNLPPPKPQPKGPVSQDEINGLYGFGGGYQMGTGTFQSGGAVIMDALNRARKANGGRTITPKDMAAILQNLPNSDGGHPGYYDDDSKSPADYTPIPADSRIVGYDHFFNNPPQSDSNWSRQDSDYRSYPSLNEQAIQRGGKVKGKR